MGYLHDLEHRRLGAELHDKLGDIGQGLRGEFVYETELISSDKDDLGAAFDGGVKVLQLFGCQLSRGRWDLGQTWIVAPHQNIP